MLLVKDFLFCVQSLAAWTLEPPASYLPGVSKSKSKFYVVWAGRRTGVFRTWTECQAQVNGYEGARYKSFKTQSDAVKAFKDGPAASVSTPSKASAAPTKPRVNRGAYADHEVALADGRWVIYSDGGCDPNPGPGGYGVVLMGTDGSRSEVSGGFRETTNNRMELMGWIEGLKLTPQQAKVAVFSDSKYVGDMYAKGYAHGWRDRGWKTASKKPAANADLWAQLLKLVDERDVVFTHVYGHTGVEENERCDVLTHEARRRDPQVDSAYESGETTETTETGLFP